MHMYVRVCGTYVVRGEALLQAGEHRVGVGRQIHVHKLVLHVEQVANKHGVLVGVAVVFLSPQGRGFDVQRTGNLRRR